MSRNDSISRRRVRRLAAPGLAAGVALSLSMPAMADGLLGTATTTAGSATSDPVGTVTSAPTTVTSTVTSAPATLSTTATTVPSSVTSTVTSAPTTVTNTVSSVTGQSAPAAPDPVSTVTGAVNTVTSTVTGSGTPKLPTGGAPSLPTNVLPTNVVPTSTAGAPGGLPTQQVCGLLDAPLGTLSSTIGQLPAPLGGTASGLVSQVAGALGCTPSGAPTANPVCSVLSTVQGIVGSLPLSALPVDLSGTVDNLLNQVGAVLGCSTGVAGVSAATPVAADPPAAAVAPSFIPTAAANFAG